MAEEKFPEYIVFSGLQRPLEFLGFRGRYIYWAAGTAGGAVFAFLLGYILIGFLVALGLAGAVLAIGGVLTFLKQRQGLFSKRIDKGIFIFVHSRQF